MAYPSSPLRRTMTTRTRVLDLFDVNDILGAVAAFALALAVLNIATATLDAAPAQQPDPAAEAAF